jgi:puromycin-sensitive aminopeptidase
VDPYRLPRTVVPTRYDLRLEPDLGEATFTGEAGISVTVREPVSEVLLNAADLNVLDAFHEALGGERTPAAVTLDAQAERCRLSFPAPLPTGPARLLLRFAGTLNDKLCGFYRSRYKDSAGQWRPLAATQFEATDARRAFPCWDEPAFKAVFATTLVIDPSLQAVSNTAVVEDTREGGKRRVRFADTIPMSTYLVAFVVGELECPEPAWVGQTPLRVWCVPGKAHLTKFGQEIGAFSLRYFEEYYGRPYPGDKLDLIAIPDFAAGAMENLGVITFRETALLVDEASATHQERERVADVVAHENAHMWFGDLVTMSWWNGLWLNEAFATFMEMLAVDAWKPAWQRWTTFGVSRSAALTVDGLQSTRPIEYPVAAPRDADAMFDVLTYEKGASVLRMLEQYVGPEVFRAGVRDYLARHAYGNTETTDLWHSLAGPARLAIPAIMDGWIFRPGYPLLTARREGDELLLSQQRFTYLPAEVGSAHASQRWQVPVQIRIHTPAGAEVRRLLLNESEVRLPLPADAGAVLVNEGGHGFYRVRYGPSLLEALLRRLPDGLAAIERFNLINDAWAAVLAALTPLTGYLDLTANFGGERDRNVWSLLVGSFHALNRIVEDADRPALSALVRRRAGPVAAELGWEPRPGEDELTGQLRADLLRALGTLGDDPGVQAGAEKVFAAAEAGAPVDAGVLAAAIAVLAHTGDAARYADFQVRFRAARTPQEEQRYLHALAGFRAPGLVRRTLEGTLNGEVRTQDAPYLVRALLYTVHGRAPAWDFVRANWERMNKEFPSTGVWRMCEGLLGLTSATWEAEVRAFVQERQVNLGGKTLEQYLEQLHIAVLLREREGEALRAYLRTQARSASEGTDTGPKR